MKQSKNKTKRIVWLSVAAVFVLLCVLVYLQVFKSFPAEETAFDALTSTDSVTVTQADGKIVFMPEQPSAGLIFYGGARVQTEAYAPLMHAFADRGVLCVLIESPFNFALFSTSAADGVKEAYPEVDTWYVGGHSLGGTVACMVAEADKDAYDGILMIASFTYKDLSDTDMTQISVYGDCDRILDLEAYENGKPYWPTATYELVIEGGNHSGYAYYGAQPHDGEAAIPKEVQIEKTADFCVGYMLPKE